MSAALVRTVPCSVRPSVRLLRACAAFGLAVTRTRRRGISPDHRADARDLLAALQPGQIALVTGPSGSGKSSVLRALSLPERGDRGAGSVRADTTRPPRPRAPTQSTHFRGTLLDAMPGHTADALSALARAGLTDALLLARTPKELSDGERARFTIALALAHAQPGDTLIFDEFLSTLDRTTARNVALSLRRWMDRAGAAQNLRLIVATAHDDILDWLAPEVLLVRQLGHARGFLMQT